MDIQKNVSKHFIISFECGTITLSNFREEGIVKSKRILIVEDEVSISDIVKFNLLKEGFEIDTAYDGEEGLKKAQSLSYDLILLDIMLPQMDGFQVCRKIRENSSVPIIMLTAKEDEVDKVLGLELGADDYITKPFSPAELTARIDALMRRLGGTSTASDEVVCGPFSLSLKSRTVMKDGERIELTQVEYMIMKLFLENPGRALSREEILKTVWGQEYFGDLKIVDVNIRRLRLKIEINPASPQYIETVWGYGYKWNA